MAYEPVDHTLENLLDYHGRTHFLQNGYSLQFDIWKVTKTVSRPYGIRYSFTVHDPDNHRILCFDNAHEVGIRAKFGFKPKQHDHWHRDGDKDIQLYDFVDAEKLLVDFFDAAENKLAQLGISMDVISEDDGS
ncbi:MAG: DUF6516 family protein [Rhodospirillales bacterium]|jgi:hypothetical protein|nr:DUF6516 family protein [Rhodospirillales bacterium]MDP6646179.1 DUF6516 family protein [Rhodospirillales bacterium]MDP6841283.1 DUF6516 family protein [Rhodospirillales bacterium]|tara:strand:+ start:595 stop:993 length:399 start_codon:yes stop_codon:yes gene_type:complete